MKDDVIKKIEGTRWVETGEKDVYLSEKAAIDWKAIAYGTMEERMRAFGLTEDYIDKLLQRGEYYTGDRDPFKDYGDGKFKSAGQDWMLFDAPIPYEGCRVDPGPKAVIKALQGYFTQAAGPAGGANMIDQGAGVEATDPSCPPFAPTYTKDADARVEWVLKHLCAGELSRLYKLLHDGRGYRVESCDLAANNWKKGLTS